MKMERFSLHFLFVIVLLQKITKVLEIIDIIISFRIKIYQMTSKERDLDGYKINFLS